MLALTRIHVARLSPLFALAASLTAIPAFAGDATAPAAPASDHTQAIEQAKARAADLDVAIAKVGETVMQLRELVTARSTLAETAVQVNFQNGVGSAFVLNTLVVRLDGQEVLKRENTDGTLDVRKAFQILSGPMRAGDHELSVSMVFIGSGSGSFPELRDYRFEVESKQVVAVAASRLTSVNLVAFPRTGEGIQNQDRIGVRFDVDVTLPAARQQQ